MCQSAVWSMSKNCQPVGYWTDLHPAEKDCRTLPVRILHIEDEGLAERVVDFLIKGGEFRVVARNDAREPFRLRVSRRRLNLLRGLGAASFQDPRRCATSS